MNLHRNLRSGFTLLEIMLVVTIIALLLGSAIYMMQGNLETAKEGKAAGDMTAMKTQLMLYQSKSGGVLPTTEQGLKALVTRPTSEPVPRNWSQLMKEIPLDPWGNEYIYVRPGKKDPAYDIYSAGADSLPDTADDIWPN